MFKRPISDTMFKFLFYGYPLIYTGGLSAAFWKMDSTQQKTHHCPGCKCDN